MFLGVVLAGVIGLTGGGEAVVAAGHSDPLDQPHHRLRTGAGHGGVLVFCQLFNCFNARSGTVSAFRHLFANRWLWGAIALSVVLQVAVVHVGFLNTAFGTVPLSWDQWLVCIAMGSVALWFSEPRKLLGRSLRRSPALQ